MGKKVVENVKKMFNILFLYYDMIFTQDVLMFRQYSIEYIYKNINH